MRMVMCTMETGKMIIGMAEEYGRMQMVMSTMETGVMIYQHIRVAISQQCLRHIVPLFVQRALSVLLRYR